MRSEHFNELFFLSCGAEGGGVRLTAKAGGILCANFQFFRIQVIFMRFDAIEWNVKVLIDEFLLLCFLENQKTTLRVKQA